jgi:hypothetical protein
MNIGLLVLRLTVGFALAAIPACGRGIRRLLSIRLSATVGCG